VVWYLEDRVVVRAMDFQIFGTLLYDDRYVKLAASGKIQHTGYERIFEEHRTLSTRSAAFAFAPCSTQVAMFDAK